MIPERIHYCWFGGGQPSWLNQRCIESWKKAHPDFAVSRWDESNSPIHHPYVKSALERSVYAFAADYVRFWALKEFGGIYLDTDMEVIRPLTPLFTANGAVGFESQGRVNAALVIAPAAHRLSEKVLERIDSYYVPRREFCILPALVSRVLKDDKACAIDIYPPEYFYPYNPYDPSADGQFMYSSVKETTYAVHHWEKSWGNKTLRRKVIARARRALPWEWRIVY